MPDSLLWVPGSALTPALCQLLQQGQEHTARTRSHGKHLTHAGAHLRDRPPIKHRHILSISLSLNEASPAEIYLLLSPAVLIPPHACCRQDGSWAPHCRHRQWGHAGTCKQRSRMHTSKLEVPAGARCSPGSWLPRKVLASSLLAGACSYFRKPPGKGRAQQSCQPRCSAPIHWEKGKSQAQPGFTCPAQCSSLAWEPDLRAPKHLAARQSCHKHRAIAALQQGHAQGTFRIHTGTEAIPGVGKRRAMHSMPQHTTCEDGRSSTSPVPGKTWLCPHTTES